MKNKLAEYIENRFGQLVDKRKKREKKWKELAKYLMPDLLVGFDSGDNEDYETPDDSRPIFYAREMADGLTAYIAPKDSRWLFYKPRDDELMKNLEVKKWLYDATLHVLAQLARSNFYDALQRYTHIGVVISTTTMFVGNNPNEGKPYFKVIHPLESYISSNMHGDIDTVFRKIKIKAIDAINWFKPTGLSKEIIKAADETPNREFDFIHAVMFVDSYDKFLTKYLPAGKNYLSIYKQVGEDAIAQIGGYITFPFGVWRYRVDSKSDYGTGPGGDALGDVKWMNQMARYILKGQIISSDPPVNIPIELKGRVRYKPHGANYYEQQGRFVEPWKIGNIYQGAVDGYRIKDESVRNHFYIDFFMVLSNLTKRMTTVEVEERQGEKMLMLSTPISKFLSEGLDKILERVLEIEIEEKRLPPPPKKLLEADGKLGKGLKIDYFSVLAQLQQRVAKGGMLKQALIDFSPIPQFKQDTIDLIDWDGLGRRILEYNNFPVDLVNDDKKVDAIRQARQEQQANSEMMSQLAQILKVNKENAGGQGNVV